MKNILIINPFGIGDVLFSTPLISALRKNFPKGYIGYICNKRVEDVLITNPNLDEVFVFEKDDYRRLWKQSKILYVKQFISFLKRIRSKNFDLAIDLSLGRHYSFFLRLIGVRKRIGFNYKNRGRFLTDKIDLKDGYTDKHVTEYYLDLLSFLGLRRKQEHNLQLFVSKDDEAWAGRFLKDNGIDDDNIVIGIIPGGGTSWGESAYRRHWSEDKFAQVADELVKKFNARVIIFGDLSEVGKCKSVISLMENKPSMACGRTTIRQFAALLSKCKLVICNDGGPLHVAVSQRTKTVSIFGPVDEGVYGPYPPSENHVVIKRGIPCRPCYKRFRIPHCESKRCINSIEPEDALKAIGSLLRK